jgi:hypothetical protein
MAMEIVMSIQANHKFRVGQLVEYAQPASARLSVPRGAFEITAQLPERDGELQYRIRNKAEDHERVARQSELSVF